MHILRSIILSCFITTAWCQTVTKVLVIDTIVGDVRKFEITLCDKNNHITPEFFNPKIDTIITPGLIVSLRYNDRGIVKLPLDDSGGYLELSGLFQLKVDTVRISKLNIFHNCLADSTSFSRSWYKEYPSDTGSYLQKLSNERKCGIIKSTCEVIYPDSIDIQVNGIQYEVELKKMRHKSQVTLGHGFAIKGGKRQERRKYCNKPYKYFAFSNERSKSILIAEILLK